ncbi:hypothetical protein P148_SR1C00001G0516 [candidate division SR1 bacterium RAAC1_SR1_1]|nr:hypothetical protein P148_SR1C00001G0516 [candidate division SR1 bacterium RAAC1_SR1_1]
MKPILVVMAAGMGSRYGGLKQIDPIGPNKEVIIDYSVFDAIKTGFGKVVFIIRKSIESDFKTFFGNRFEQFLPVEYVYQELDNLPLGFSVPEGRVKPWGTAHALLVAKDVIDAPFAAINADDFYGRDAFAKLSQFLTTNQDPNTYALVGYRLKNTISDFGSVNRGICSADGDVLSDIVETKNIHTKNGEIGYIGQNDQWFSLAPDTLVSMNFFGFMPSILDYIEIGFKKFLQAHGQELTSEYYIPAILDELIKNNQSICKIIPNDSSWFGVTYPEDKPQVVSSIQKLITQKEYPDHLWE